MKNRIPSSFKLEANLFQFHIPSKNIRQIFRKGDSIMPDSIEEIIGKIDTSTPPATPPATPPVNPPTPATPPAPEGGDEKTNQAFAKMRIDLSNKDKEMVALQQAFDEYKKNHPETPAPQVPPVNTPEQNPEILKMQEKVTALENQLKAQTSEALAGRIRDSLVDLQGQYNLSREDLYQFAQDIKDNGLDASKPQNYLSYYRQLHFADIVAAEVAKAQAQLNGGTPPSAGPQGGKQTPPSKGSITDVINAIGDKYTK